MTKNDNGGNKNWSVHEGELPSPIELMAEKFGGEDALIRAAFACSFFVHPERVKEKTPRLPERARYSKTYYPGKKKGEWAKWKGNPVKLDDNSAAQRAWASYTARSIQRRSGYGVRHIWGHPWNPNAFTAGWNLCYMPFWAGMLTEEQHPHEKLQRAFQQASWNLFFGEDPACPPPDFVSDPEMDLESILGSQRVLILARQNLGNVPRRAARNYPASSNAPGGDAWEKVQRIRTESHASWCNIRKAVMALQGKSHEPFGTPNVKSSTESVVRRMTREAEIDLATLEKLLNKHSIPR